MSSASRKAVAIVVVFCGIMSAVVSTLADADLSAVASATADPGEPKVEYDGRFAFVRLRYGPAVDMSGGYGRYRREPPWMHDFPRADFHFLKILSEITFVRTYIDEGMIITLDDPDLFMYPVAYMSEPGFWTMNDAELQGLRSYLQKGGFIIFDDFRGNHIENLFFQMRRVLPDAKFQKLDVSHPIFHSFFEIRQLDPNSGYYAQMGATEWFGIFEDNNPQKRLLAIANNNHDLGELWEFSDTGYMPVDLSNEAYKFGVNYVIYGMTH